MSSIKKNFYKYFKISSKILSFTKYFTDSIVSFLLLLFCYEYLNQNFSTNFCFWCKVKNKSQQYTGHRIQQKALSSIFWIEQLKWLGFKALNWPSLKELSDPLNMFLYHLSLQSIVRFWHMSKWSPYFS